MIGLHNMNYNQGWDLQSICAFGHKYPLVCIVVIRVSCYLLMDVSTRWDQIMCLVSEL